MITLSLLTSAISSMSTGRTSPISSPTSLPPYLLEHRAVEDPSQCFCPNTRSILGIVWSCLSTIFLCTWVAIHPNVPPTGEMGFITFLRRVKMLFVALLAPELIMVFALFQRMTARRELIKYKSRGWTMSHGHLLIMGGFVLMKGEEDMGTLSYGLLEQLDKDGDIEFPTITQEQIQDRSKGDFLSKGIVVLQALWFIISCIARTTQGLEVTQIEVVTLAYCSLNAAIYFLWWSKPLDVQTPTPVFLKSGSNYVHKPELKRAEVIDDNHGTHRNIAEALGVDGPQAQRTSRIFKYWSPFGKALVKSAYREIIPIELTPEGVPKKWAEWDPSESTFSTISRCFSILFDLILSAGFFIFFSPVWLLKDMFNDRALPPGQPGVRTFYYSTLDDWEPDRGESVVLLIISLLFTPVAFGALHCLAWKAYFPTGAETIMWRCLSLLITLIPVSVSVALAIGTEMQDWASNALARKSDQPRRRYCSTTIIWLTIKAVANFTIACAVMSSTPYFFARLILLILSVISLRSLGPTALLDVTWSDFVPHF